jgi:hypothetical protein
VKSEAAADSPSGTLTTDEPVVGLSNAGAQRRLSVGDALATRARVARDVSELIRILDYVAAARRKSPAPETIETKSCRIGHRTEKQASYRP